jgi:homocitrate synthase NifV
VATVGVNAEDGSRTDAGYLTEFALAAREAGADRVRYCDTIGGDTPWRIRERFAGLAGAVGIPVETHCHNDLAWPWPTRSPAPSATWTPARTPGSTPA